jgi:hypothetical protein
VRESGDQIALAHRGAGPHRGADLGAQATNIARRLLAFGLLRLPDS